MAPPVPQVYWDCWRTSTHVPPLVQQPVLQLAEVHLQVPVAASQPLPLGQLTHAAPPMPHWALVWGVTQVSPLQHPVLQLLAVQTHVP